MDNSPKTKTNHYKWFSMFACIIAVFAFICVGFLWLQLIQLNQRQVTLITQQSKQMSDINMQIMDIKNNIALNKQNTKSLLRNINNSEQQRIISNASAMLNIANLELSIHLNNNRAIQALEKAQQQISLLDEPQTEPLKAAIQHTITSIKDTKQPSAIQLIYQLNTINKQIANLDFVPTRLPKTELKNQNKSNPQKPWYENLWSNIITSLHHVIVLRHNDPKLTLLIDPQQQLLLGQLIQNHIVSTQSAILQRNNKLFHQQLEQVKLLVNTHYLPSDQKNSVVSLLQKLQTTDIKPIKNNIESLIKQLNEVINNSKIITKSPLQLDKEASA